ncbi:MAG: hypothetical protein OEV36_11960 [Myxococcales bacterium]|nr:hypothetical protein [Myxococcales bacterium]
MTTLQLEERSESRGHPPAEAVVLVLEVIAAWPRYIAAQRQWVVLRVKPPATSGYTFLAALMLPKSVA